ncbi:hypothetical protein HPB50_002077 [Hyalomma asiaticum]|uniref:Uncharacterized protein n=1 Tax=Hyalomma asiaticum TaxID=266040 RepID=A0ACB7T457_HYAAI|nr:hypothetical protein HPB50_002077 [Hyalomma asiaticum]
MFQRAIVILLVLLSRRLTYTRTNETVVLGYLTGSQRLPGDRSYRRPGLAISGALTLAVDKVNLRAPLLGGLRLGVLVAETFGRERHSVLQTARLWRQNVSAFIGPQETCVHEAYLAAALNMPMVSYFCLDRETSDKQRFPTFARTRPPETHISKSVAALLAHFGWRQVALFYASRLGHVADGVMATLTSHGVRLRHRGNYGGGLQNVYSLSVQHTIECARAVFIVLGQYFEQIGLMASLEARGLLQGGEYFVVGVDVQQYDVETPTRYLTGLFREEPDPPVVRAFRSYLGIVGSPATGFEEFSVAVNEYMQRPPFNIVNAADTIGGRKKIPSEGAYLYDAVMVYARAVNACVEHGGDFRNGKHLFEHMRGRSYHSAMGYMVRMDDNGDAEGNYTLIARKKRDGKSGSAYGLFPVGVFELSGNGSTLPVLKLFDTIEWIKGAPPRDEPPCGFNGEKCIHYFFLSVSPHSFALSLVRYWAYEQALDRLLWKLDFDEIQMRGGPTAHQQATKTSSCASHCGGSGPSDKSGGGLMPVPTSSQLSLSSHPEFRYSQLYAPVGVYRGRLCAVKKIHTKSLLLTRTLKKQLNLLRDLRHDNLCSLVGVCVEPPNVCVVTDYCSRGSLRDLLDNEDIRLDNMFVASLVDDLVRGMLFLHESPVRSHGDLRSANCLVDSRWVLKVADFGLAQIKHSAGDDGQRGGGQRQSKEYRLLWRAPELLRDPESPPEGTPRGDVYSFGIVLFEMLARSGPYGKTTLTATEMDSEKQQEPQMFRPPLCELAEPWDVEYVRTLLTECWSEAPDERPDFKAVRARLRHMRRGLKPSIVDNMLSMMETYATNLEALVDQRTDQLAQEKRRADALLYEMLPRTVADQLKRGKKVEAESFDSVVELLNDLYTCFDAVIENYAVYKVETIGDAYMVVGGLARHPGVAHASQVASMALHLLKSVRHFRIRHKPKRCSCFARECIRVPFAPESWAERCLVTAFSVTRSTRLPGWSLQEHGKGDMRTFWLEGRASGIRCRSTTGFQNVAGSSGPHDPQPSEGSHSCPDLGAPPWQGII